MNRLKIGSALLALMICVAWPHTASAQLVINEVVAQNSTAEGPDGGTPDYIEIYNNSTSEVSLNGWTLTDDLLNANKFVFPSTAKIAGNGYAVVWLDSATNLPGFHATFSLTADGELAALYFVGVRQDLVDFGLQISDFSISRIPNGGANNWSLAAMTPGAANQSVTLGVNLALRFNEWMATNSAGEDEDWVELYNPPTNGPVALGGLIFSDEAPPNPPNEAAMKQLSFVAPGSFKRLWCDNAASKGANHLPLRLSSSNGETLSLYQSDRINYIDRVIFGAQVRDVSLGRLPDGSTNIIAFPVGRDTPGDSNFLPLTNIVANEMLAHTDLPLEDAVEFFNTGPTNVNIGGWWLSNNENNPYKYRVPSGTIIPTGGFKVFYEYQFNPDRSGNAPSFTLNSAQGDQVCLFSADANGVLTGYRLIKDFPSTENGVSLGRYVKSDGGTDFVPLNSLSFGTAVTKDYPAIQFYLDQFRTGAGAANAQPLVGPLVISELFYRPPPIILGTNVIDNELDEYIELRNTRNAPLPLYSLDPESYGTNTWRIRNAVDYDFPLNTTIAANGNLVLVNFDPATNATTTADFRSRLNIPASVPIFGPYKGKLSNRSATVELYKPDPVQLPGRPDAGYVPYIFVEKVKYEDRAPWPTNTDGTGFSLQRLNLQAYANDQTNWFGAAPTTGRDNVTSGSAPVISVNPISTAVVAGESAQFQVVATGAEPLNYQWYFVSGALSQQTNDTLALSAVKTNDAGGYRVVISNSFGSATSLFAQLTVNPPPKLQLPQLTTGSGVTFKLEGMVGRTLVIEHSSNLTNWQFLTNLTLNVSPTVFTNADAPLNTNRFYRSRLQ